MTQPSVLDQLKSIVKALQSLQRYMADVGTNDWSDMIFYSNMEDKFILKINEIDDRTKEHDCAGVLCHNSVHDIEGSKGKQ